MSNIPLHPMVVHFPIVLSILLPLFAIATLWLTRGQFNAARKWSIPLMLAAGLFVSAFVATRTGSNEEERVEDVVAERAIHEHEEAAERFLVFSGIVLVIAAAGLIRGRVGAAARATATAGSLLLVAAGFQVGRAGGDLVYRHNAGAAYAAAGSNQENTLKEGGNRVQDNDD